MSLSTAMDTAKSSLQAAQTQTSIISRNIANVNTVGATAKSANVVTGANGRVTVTSISQSSNAVLFRNALDANAAVGKNNVIANGLNRVADTLGDNGLNRSPAALVSALGDALNTLSASPNNYELARNAATAAQDLVTSLNDASLTVQTIRRDADTELVAAAEDMTKILAKIEELNNQIVKGSRVGADVTDLSDQRDQQVVALSSYVGVSAQVRGDNDLVLYTDSGVTLFETRARTVEFTSTPGLNESVAAGNTFRIDGMSVTGENSYMPVKSGSVAGLIALRDDVMITYQNQIDEISRGLVAAFAESDPAGVGAEVEGLFASIEPPEPLVLSHDFAVGTIQAGDRLSFDVSYGNETYKASHVFTGTPTQSQYQDALETAIATAVSASGSGLLGAGKVVVANAGTTVTVSAVGAGAYSPFAISNIAAGASDAAKDGGLVVDTVGAQGIAAEPAEIPVGIFNGAGIVNGQTLDLSFSVDNVNYQASLIFTGPVTATEFRNKVQLAINGARSVPDGVALGNGKVVFSVDPASVPVADAMTLSSVGTGSARSLSFNLPTGTATTGFVAATPAQTGIDATTVSIGVGTYDAGTIAAGDTLSFDFQLDGTSYRATHTFTSSPATASAFETAIQAAINSAVSAVDGSQLGAGKVGIDIDSVGGVTLSTLVAGDDTLTLTRITGTPAGSGASAKTGGLRAASDLADVTGLANKLRLGAGVAADPTKVRDGVVYDYNPSNTGGYTTRLNALDDALNASRAFSVTSGADPSASVAGYAASSVSWLQANRQEYLSETEYRTTLLEQTQKALSSATGINMDEQLTKLIEIERSYQASSKLISTIDEMLQTLLNSI